MNTKISATLLGTIALAASSLASAAPINVIDGDHDVINGVYSYDPGLSGLGHTSTLFSDTAAGWGSVLADNKTIVVEQRGLDGADATAASNWIAAGGRMIVLGDTFAASTDSFLTAVLGTPTAPGSSGGSAAKTAAAAGTTFADDPANIYYASSTHPIASGNIGIDEVFYTGTGGDWVTRSVIGSGDLFYLAWDFCCGSESVSTGWYSVLDSAINFEAPEASSVPEPSSIFMLALGLAGLFTARRMKQV